MVDFNQYVNSHLSRKIDMGKSGADVYELDNSCIAKHIRRSELGNDSLWNSYKNESLFYTHFSSKTYPFLPEVYHLYQSDDEIQLVMKRYQPLDRNCFDDTMFEKIIAVLANVHSLPVPDFLPRTAAKPIELSQDDISQYLSVWHDVINEHGQEFPADKLSEIAENINTVNQKLYSEKQWVCHGDFHFENLLSDDNGNIIVCDWQGIGLGHVSGDISFFLSRLSADGINISKDKAIQTYCNFSNSDIKEEIALQMSLSNLNVSFMYWHEYLHGCSNVRVGEIYYKMIEDMDYLSGFCGLSATYG